MNGKFMRNGIVMLVLVVGTMALLYTFLMSSPTDQSVAYSQFLQNVQGAKVKIVEQQDLRLTVTDTGGATYAVIVPGVGFTDVFGDIREAAESGNVTPSSIEFKGKEASQSGQWISLLIGALLPVLLIGGFIFFMMRQAQGTNNQALSASARAGPGCSSATRPSSRSPTWPASTRRRRSSRRSSSS